MMSSRLLFVVAALLLTCSTVVAKECQDGSDCGEDQCCYDNMCATCGPSESVDDMLPLLKELFLEVNLPKAASTPKVDDANKPVAPSLEYKPRVKAEFCRTDDECSSQGLCCDTNHRVCTDCRNIRTPSFASKGMSSNDAGKSTISAPVLAAPQLGRPDESREPFAGRDMNRNVPTPPSLNFEASNPAAFKSKQAIGRSTGKTGGFESGASGSSFFQAKTSQEQPEASQRSKFGDFGLGGTGSFNRALGKDKSASSKAGSPSFVQGGSKPWVPASGAKAGGKVSNSRSTKDSAYSGTDANSNRMWDRDGKRGRGYGTR